MNERISKNENKGSNGNNSVVLSIWPICSRHRRGWDWLLVSDCGLESKRHHRRREERRRTVDGKPWVRSLERRRASARGLARPYLAECGNTRATHSGCRALFAETQWLRRLIPYSSVWMATPRSMQNYRCRLRALVRSCCFVQQLSTALR